MTHNIAISKMYTVEELHNGAINSIPSESGVYFVLMPKGFDLIVKDVTDGRKTTSKGKVASYPVDDLQRRILHYGNRKKYNSQILYIGKSDNLCDRIKQYIGFRYNDPGLAPHNGGRSIWQLENNERLLFCYHVCRPGEDCEKMEKELLLLYKDRHGCYPFANRRL